MSREYDLYLEQHKANVRKGFEWINENLPDLIGAIKMATGVQDLEHQICFAHDASKSEPDEYWAYDRYFYGRNRSYQCVQDFRRAWLQHIHRNPHHWQHWILINDDPNEGEIIMDIPFNYTLEMVCDWWAFSWNKGSLREIFKWYDEHKDYMKLSERSRKDVEYILEEIIRCLDEKEKEE
jgi:hypothetical protein